MLEQLKYKNHQNEVFEFGKDGIFVEANELHDYECVRVSVPHVWLFFPFCHPEKIL